MTTNVKKVIIIGRGENAGNIPLNIVLEKFCYMRTARNIGDIETVNHTQLGRLQYHQISYKIIE